MSSWDPKNRAILLKTILSGHLPILIDYSHSYRPRDITGSAIWRMRAALKHRDRVREISFGGSDFIFGKFTKATSHHFFPHWRAFSFAFHLATNRNSQPLSSGGQINQIYVFNVLNLYGGSVASVSGLFVVRNSSHRPHLERYFYPCHGFRPITRIVPSCLFARHAMPTQSQSDHRV